jgi:ribosome-associated protein
VEQLFTYKVIDPVLIDLRNVKSVLDDYLVICTCRSESQMRAIFNNVRKVLKKQNIKEVRMDCPPGVRWGVLECGFIVLHLFEKTTRNFYSLERLWADADIIRLTPEKSPTVEQLKDESQFL